MQKIIAKIISIMLHPSLMPFYGLFIIYNSGTYLSHDPLKFIIILIFLIGTLLLPLAFLPFFLYKNLIKSVEMKTTKERVLPFFLGFLFYYLTYLYINKEPTFHNFIKEFLLASAITVFVLFFISIIWKISAHMAGIGGIVALIAILIIGLAADIQIFLIGSIFLAGLLGSARLVLDAHSPAQIYTGFCVGFVTVFLSLLIL